MAEVWRVQSSRLRGSAAPATLVLLGTTVVLWVATTLSSTVFQWLCVGSAGDFAYEYWRPLLFSLTTGGLLQMVLNGLALYFMGAAMERSIGSAAFAAAYVLSGLGAGAVLALAGPGVVFGGSFAGILGLVAAQVVLKRRAHLDVRADIAFLVLMVLLGLLGSGNVFMGGGVLRGAWLGDLGAIGVGAALGAVHASSGWKDRGRRQARGFAAVGLVCLLALTLGWVLPR